MFKYPIGTKLQYKGMEGNITDVDAYCFWVMFRGHTIPHIYPHRNIDSPLFEIITTVGLKCECGVSSLRKTDQSNYSHGQWCPLFKRG